jgi:hypothetical protein
MIHEEYHWFLHICFHLGSLVRSNPPLCAVIGGGFLGTMAAHALRFANIFLHIRSFSPHHESISNTFLVEYLFKQFWGKIMVSSPFCFSRITIHILCHLPTLTQITNPFSLLPQSERAQEKVGRARHEIRHFQSRPPVRREKADFEPVHVVGRLRFVGVDGVWRTGHRLHVSVVPGVRHGGGWVGGDLNTR